MDWPEELPLIIFLLGINIHNKSQKRSLGSHFILLCCGRLCPNHLGLTSLAHGWLSQRQWSKPGPLLGPYSLRIKRLIGIGIPIINLRRSPECLWFMMEIPIDGVILVNKSLEELISTNASCGYTRTNITAKYNMTEPTKTVWIFYEMCCINMSFTRDKDKGISIMGVPLQWRHNECDGVSSHRHMDCLHSVCSGADQRK